ncbi:hypothetical protein TWF281_008716 [Arthrobotrys megalospora]
MDGLSAAASVIAVLQVATEVAKICGRYAREVKNAPKEIKTIKEQADTTLQLLFHTQKLLDGPYRNKLSASRDLGCSLSECKDELNHLLTKLEANFAKPVAAKDRRRDKILRPFKINPQDFKWPFTKKEVEDVVNRLLKLRQAIDHALQIDQIKVVLSVEQKANLAKLSVSDGAIFNSFEDEGEPECLPGTRTDLLGNLNAWIEDPRETRIFWLCGMAGTGKSTISRTFARTLSENGQLGASFFFKRGKANRGDASRFISTISIELQTIIPQLGPHISEAVEKDPNIGQKALFEQFQRLLLDPLKTIDMANFPDPHKALVLVIDALDECEGNGSVRRIIELLGSLADVDLNIRIFITSRPEAPIKAGFINLRKDHKDVSLHIIQEPTIKHDILIYIRHEFDAIRKSRKLGTNWPGDGTIITLADMTAPLFISAATLCRFIGDQKFSVHQRLANVLKLRNASFVSKLDQTYRPIFNQILADTDTRERDELIQDFHDIVSTIVLLESPLDLHSLSILLHKEEDHLLCRLDQFQSVINIPDDPKTPIYIYHLSFRDYLLDDNNKGSWFHICTPQIQWNIGKKCLQLLSKTLREDICNLLDPGTKVSSVDENVRRRYILPEIAYSCLYWVHHITHSAEGLNLDEERSTAVLEFLQSHLLHWLEVMGILGASDQVLSAIGNLKSSSQALSELVYDSTCFINLHSTTISETPLQLYSSALLFTPETSLVKKLFFKNLPPWIRNPPVWHRDWGTCVQGITDPGGGSASRTMLVVSPDGRFVAYDLAWTAYSLVVLLNAASKTVLQSIEVGLLTCNKELIDQYSTETSSDLPCNCEVSYLDFTPDSECLVIALSQAEILLWDIIAGKLIRRIDIFAGLNSAPQISSSDGTTRPLYRYGFSVRNAVFSSDCSLLALSTPDKLVSLWARSNSKFDFLPSYLEHPELVSPGADVDVSWDISDMKFTSGDAYLVAMVHAHGHDWSRCAASETDTENERRVKTTVAHATCVWSTTSGSIIKLRTNKTASVPIVSTLSTNGETSAIALADSTIEIRDVVSGTTLQKFKPPPTWDGVPEQACALEFSPNGRLAVGYTGVIRILDFTASTYIETDTSYIHEIYSMCFSRDGGLLFFTDGFKLRVWSVDFSAVPEPSNNLEQNQDGPEGFKMLKSHRFWNSGAHRALISPDYTRLAVERFSPDKMINIWDPVSRRMLNLLSHNSILIDEMAFSADSRWLVAVTSQGVLMRWEISADNENPAPTIADLKARVEAHKSECRKGVPRSLSPSADGNKLFYLIGDGSVEAWDWVTHSDAQLYTGQRGPDLKIAAVKLMLDGRYLAIVKPLAYSVEFLDLSTRLVTKTLALGLEREVLFEDSKPKGHRDDYNMDPSPQNVAFSRDGKLFATFRNTGNEVLAYDIESGQEILKYFHYMAFRCLSFAPEGRILEIDNGYISLDIDNPDTFDLSRPLHVEGGWIHVKGHAVLRLPAELWDIYSGAFMGISGSVVIFLLGNQPVFIEISDQHLPVYPEAKKVEPGRVD